MSVNYVNRCIRCGADSLVAHYEGEGDNIHLVRVECKDCGEVQ